MVRRSLVPFLVLVLAFALVGCRGSGQYPTKPVTMIVPFPAGGAMDQTARALADSSKNHFSQPFTIQNRAGAAGTVGATEAVQARADGYTLAINAVGVMAVQPHLTDVAYKLPPEDYQPILKVVDNPIVLAVRQDAPWRTMQEVLDHAKANPGQLRTASPGIGTILHIDLELLKEQAGVNFTHVPAAGGAETVPGLLGGHVETLVAHPAEVVGHVQAGTIRVLGVFQPQRNPLFPEAPTFRELGYDITHAVYYFMMAPKGTPQDIVQSLHDSLKKAIEEDSFKRFAIEKGFGLDPMGPEALTEQLRKDYAFYGDMAQKLNLKAS